MTYDPTDGTSLTELIRLVRIRTGDQAVWRKKTITVNADEMVYYIDRNALSATVACNLTGSSDTDLVSANGMEALYYGDQTAFTAFTFDEETGDLTLSRQSQGQLTVRYKNTVWSDERITEAVNAAIDELAQWFTVVGENSALVTDGNGELLVETAAGYDLGRGDRVTKVEYWTGSRWKRLDAWGVDTHGGKKYLTFEQQPAAGQRLRVAYMVRPGNLDIGSETIEGTSGLPSQAKEPLVLFATADLQADRMHHRIKDDRAHNSQNENPLKSYEIQNDAQYLRSLAELKASRLRDPRAPIRVRY